MTIPWRSLYSLPVKVNIEDVYVLAGPITDRSYDARKEAALNNAIKRAKLAELDKSRAEDEGELLIALCKGRSKKCALNTISIILRVACEAHT